MKKSAIIMLFAFALIGCKKPVTSGQIVEKHHNEGSFWVQPTGHGIIVHNVPESWVFVLKNCEKSDKCEEGELEVDEQVYNSFEVGNQYPSPELPKQ